MLLEPSAATGLAVPGGSPAAVAAFGSDGDLGLLAPFEREAEAEAGGDDAGGICGLEKKSPEGHSGPSYPSGLLLLLRELFGDFGIGVASAAAAAAAEALPLTLGFLLGEVPTPPAEPFPFPCPFSFSFSFLFPVVGLAPTASPSEHVAGAAAASPFFLDPLAATAATTAAAPATLFPDPPFPACGPAPCVLLLLLLLLLTPLPFSPAAAAAAAAATTPVEDTEPLSPLLSLGAPFDSVDPAEGAGASEGEDEDASAAVAAAAVSGPGLALGFWEGQTPASQPVPSTASGGGSSFLSLGGEGGRARKR